MMPIVPIAGGDDARLVDYAHVSDPERLRRTRTFVAEGRSVVRTLLGQRRFRVRSVLVTETARRSLADLLEPRLADLPVFVVPPGLIKTITGFNIHRGCLAIGECPARTSVEDLLETLPQARRLVVIEQVANADNLGGLFRNAAAFAADGVVVGPHCCDPLYRKTIRVSMGAALRVSFSHTNAWPADLDTLRARGFVVAALTPAADAVPLAGVAAAPPGRIAWLAGAEGTGLTAEALSRADLRVRIPMAAGVDSLNVATAVGIALARLFET